MQVLALLFSVCASTISANEKITRFVDPFVGTANGGNTFPGAVRPWGMVSVSPHTDPGSPSGYVSGRPWFYGLGQVHLSGTGCADLGSIIVIATSGNIETVPERYRCTLKNEEAHPGYWAGTIDEPSVRLEATATLRSGIIRLTPSHGEAFNLLIDAGRNLSMVGGGLVRWVSRREVEGFNLGGGFCGEGNRHTVYFVASLSRDPLLKGSWRDTVVTADSASHAEGAGVGAWARVTGPGPIEVRIGISYVSIANARLNRDAETRGRTFGELRLEADNAWVSNLSRVAVSGGSDTDRTRFYTALYHCLIHPNIISDVNGEYPLFGRNGVGKNSDREHYTVFSLWDTYRTLHPLLTLLYPERQSEIVNTMLDMYRESGWLPKWELGGNETHMMVGDGAVAVIADTYLKGIRDFDTLLAYEAMRKPGLDLSADAEPSRPGYADYLRLGYIPVDQDTSRAWWVWGAVSTTLEYCLADWAFSRVAEAMGKTDDAREFSRRSLFYRNLYDSSTHTLRPRLADRQWLTPFDPLSTEGSGNWSGSGGPGYVEGNARQYSWFVPHDITGLANLNGGSDSSAARLDQLFASGQFTVNNEPDIAYPYIFTYFPGHERRTAEIVRAIMEKDFTTGPAGLPGNDDAGTISAWFVFSALGIYPACPGSGEYRLGSPLFQRTEISLHRPYATGTLLIIERTVSTTPEPHTGEITWNGTPITGFGIRHRDLISGGRLTFTTSP